MLYTVPSSSRDTTQAIDPSLLAALALAKHPNAATRSKSLLSSWCAGAANLNQKMMIGIVNYLSELHPDKNAGAAQVIQPGQQKTYIYIML